MRLMDAVKKKKQDDDAIIVPVLLSPYMLLRKEATFSTHQLLSHFDVMDRAVANGGSIANSGAIGDVLNPAIIRAHRAGFAAAAKLTGKTASQQYWDRLAIDAAKRAKKVNQWMLSSTKNMLEESPDSDFVFSEARAARAVDYEMSQAFFQGVQTATAGSGMYKEWLTAEDPCDDCIDNEDMGFIEIDDVFTSGDAWPPAHINCFLPSTIVTSVNTTDAIRRWYEGKINILRFAGGPDLSVTPNHPILTMRGWVAAGLLKPGDYVLQCLSPANTPPFSFGISPNFDYVETRISDVFESFRMTSSMRSASVPSSTEAFHGDGVVNSKIDIVGTARKFSNRLELYDDIIHLNFARAHGSCLVSLSSGSSLGELIKAALLPSNSHMSRPCVSSVLFGRSAGVAKSNGLRHAAFFKSKLAPSSIKCISSNAGIISNFDSWDTSKVQFVQLTGVYVDSYFGHVFNLGTKDQYYLANSIVVHNCRCDLELSRGGR